MDDLGRIDATQAHAAQKHPIIVILDDVRSMQNVGSVFRTCDAFRIEKLYLCGITACPPNKDIHKTALGATESVKWEYYEETLKIVQKLKSENYKILAAEQVEGSTGLQNMDLVKGNRYAIVFGHEVHGVEQGVIDQCDVCIEIPQAGTKHSLNVAVSAGIVLWDAFKKLGL